MDQIRTKDDDAWKELNHALSYARARAIESEGVTDIGVMETEVVNIRNACEEALLRACPGIRIPVEQFAAFARFCLSHVSGSDYIDGSDVMTYAQNAGLVRYLGGQEHRKLPGWPKLEGEK